MQPLEQILSTKLRKFSILDFACVKSAYVVLALLIFSIYTPLRWLSPWVYLILFVLSALPLWMHFFAAPGNLLKKSEHYLKTNNPSNQVLTLISCFSFGIFLALLFPVLGQFSWWIYILAILGAAIKPIKVAWF